MWTLTNNKTWESIRSEFDFVRDMEGMPQDPVHHAEGDVAVHTRMVLDELQKLEGYMALGPQDQETLWAAALLHDVEKRSTTVREEDGSITAKGHAKKGAMTARLLLYTQYPTPFTIREHVVNLVRYHGLPLWAIEKPDPAKAVIEASMIVDTKLLSLLARADALGRVCRDQQDLLYRIDLFDTLCQENDCWGKARKFASPNAKFQYFRREDAYADFVPFDDFGSTVIILSGLPGAGKDTYVFHHYRDWLVINLDVIRREHKISATDKSGNGRVIQMAKERARAYLRKKQNFVWNATNITKAMREQLVELFVTYKAYVKIVYVEVPYHVLHQQNNSRDAVLPAVAVDRLVGKLEVPSPWEGHEVEFSVKDE
ncbi:MAG: HDIG domain-containing protein [Sphingobacteriales bacterium]|nr:MAG: HDIG domain-containing protein [Sphingobacteriales bacterium]